MKIKELNNIKLTLHSEFYHD